MSPGYSSVARPAHRKVNPLVRLAHRAEARATTLAREFGLMLDSRARVLPGKAAEPQMS